MTTGDWWAHGEDAPLTEGELAMSAECGYCLARLRVREAAAITTDNETVYLCHPDEGQDCYRLVTIYHKPLADGRQLAHHVDYQTED